MKLYLSQSNVNDLRDVASILRGSETMRQDLLSQMLGYLANEEPFLQEQQKLWWLKSCYYNKLTPPSWLEEAV